MRRIPRRHQLHVLLARAYGALPIIALQLYLQVTHHELLAALVGLAFIGYLVAVFLWVRRNDMLHRRR
jgi:hypothetical protein